MIRAIWKYEICFWHIRHISTITMFTEISDIFARQQFRRNMRSVSDTLQIWGNQLLLQNGVAFLCGSLQHHKFIQKGNKIYNTNIPGKCEKSVSGIWISCFHIIDYLGSLAPFSLLLIGWSITWPWFPLVSKDQMDCMMSYLFWKVGRVGLGRRKIRFKKSGRKLIHC